MAKTVKAKVKLKVPAGAATPAPPVGSALGQQGVNIMDFCKQFNAKTAHAKGEMLPVIVTVYIDKSFDFVVKTPETSALLKKKIKLEKGSSKPNTDKIGKLTWKDIEDIASVKMPDLNALDLEQAKKIVAGTARSMGIDIV
ncbi:MAG: 50S ribosomal protein L11 [Candidatus Dependentiae bacterium ADurb.Bin331]|nr:MAG: 50S ribosomal protein L11 [Candidatus Dependentiae bacterium ADurb.Bin331]